MANRQSALDWGGRHSLFGGLAVAFLRLLLRPVRRFLLGALAERIRYV